MGARVSFQLAGRRAVRTGVPLQGDSRWIGAGSRTNNVGEVTAMVEALLWLQYEAPGPESAPATIFYDSTYAFNALTGTDDPEANLDLIRKARAVFASASSTRNVFFRRVKGHSGDLGNDRLAGRGARGEQSSQSARWLSPMNVPAAIDPLLIDHCWRCGRVYSGPSYARELPGHEAHCKIAGAPPSHISCRHSCGRLFSLDLFYWFK